MKTLIELVNVGKNFHLGNHRIQALQSINLKIQKGEFLSIIGQSGSGKSTLLHLIGFMDKPDHGSIIFKDVDTRKFQENELAQIRSEKIGFVFQDFHLLEDLTIEENIALPLMIKSGKGKLTTQERKKLDLLLEKLHLRERRYHKPKQISGGQKQRAAIARALIGEPEIILADEPTGNLDSETSNQIIRLLQDISTENKITMIIVTHDHKIAERADRIIQINEGKLSNRPHLEKYLD